MPGNEILLQNKNKWTDKISINSKARGSVNTSKSRNRGGDGSRMQSNNMQVAIVNTGSSRGQLVKKKTQIERPALDLIGYKNDSKLRIT